MSARHPITREDRRAIARQYLTLREAFWNARRRDDIVGMRIFRRGLDSLRHSHRAARSA